MFRNTNTAVNLISRLSYRTLTIKSRSMQSTGLWDAVKSTTTKAQKEGSLFTIKTTPEFLQNSGIKFLLRIANSLAAKPTGDLSKDKREEKPSDPFENPSTKDLFVKGLTPTHSLMLNKFNVSDYHVLIVTNEFQHQSEPLNIEDFEALSIVVSDMKGVGFYNAGELSGASQPHKHLQFIPFGADEQLPVDPIIEKSKSPKDIVFSIPDLPYVNKCCVLSDFTAKYLHDVYEKVLSEALADLRRTLNDESLTLEKMSYNFLMTHNWMMIVPRRLPEYEGLSVNSLGMAGWFFAKNDEQLNKIKHLGPLNVLQGVGYAKKNLQL